MDIIMYCLLPKPTALKLHNQEKKVISSFKMEIFHHGELIFGLLHIHIFG